MAPGAAVFDKIALRSEDDLRTISKLLENAFDEYTATVGLELVGWWLQSVTLVSYEQKSKLAMACAGRRTTIDAWIS